VDGFDAARVEWNRLVSRLDPPSPFQSWEWQHAWWRHFASPRSDRLHLLFFRREGELVGIAPYFERKRFGLAELRPLCWRDRITEHATLLFPPVDQEELLNVLWQWLATRRWTSAAVPQVPGEDSLPAEARSQVVGVEEIVFEYLRLPASWEAFEAGLGGSLRGNLRYYPRLMIREGHSHSFAMARTAREVTAALPVLWGLHSARAAAPTANRHLDYLKPARRRAFLLDVVPELAAQGRAGVGLFSMDGQVVSAQLWLEQDGVRYPYYSGFATSATRYSAGMLTTAEVLKDAVASGVTRVEFLRGANHFKSRWGTQTRVDTDVVLAPGRHLVRAQETYARHRKSLRRKLDRWRTRLELMVSSPQI